MNAKRRILIASMDPDVRSLQGALKASSLDVETLDGAGQAWTSLLGSRADLVLVDLDAPRGDAFKLLENIRRSRGGVPVLTVATHVADAVAAMRLGAVDCLEKPTDVARTLLVVAAALRLPSSRGVEPARSVAARTSGRDMGAYRIVQSWV